MKSPTFIDRVQIEVHAGRGGDGCASFRREKYIPYGGPDGGDGGKGGDVILRGSKDVDSLRHLYYQPIQRAEHGGPGRSKQCYGRCGQNRVVPVACGTEVWDIDTGDKLGEVLAEGEELVVARGGRGGLGNMHFMSSTHQAPRECTPGADGEEKHLRLELKLISDVGLVGYPNAGKSTLLGKISAAHPKVASYPFTTLHPVIGTVIYDDYRTIRVADIPGLIDGAHEGVGLGHDFLRHIERTRFLVMLIDLSGMDGRKPADDYLGLRRELELYDPALAARPFLVVCNKMDRPEAQANLAAFKRATRTKPLLISADTGEGVAALCEELRVRILGDAAGPDGRPAAPANPAPARRKPRARPVATVKRAKKK